MAEHKTSKDLETALGHDQEQRKAKVSILAYGVAPYQSKAGEAYMNSDQQKHFRQLLNNWKRALMEGVDVTIQDLSSTEPCADPSDQATTEEVISLELRTRDRERKLIKKIDEALDLLDRNEYGYCEECGVEIGVGRLEARPTATLCIDCKTIDEVREKRR
ncbi:MAG: RNA polymerase-binding protein DksA [Pseudomonadota bacterium]